jgi:hypothetical protein
MCPKLHKRRDRSTLNSGNSCYRSVQSVLSSHLLSRNVKVTIYKTIILPVVWVWNLVSYITGTAQTERVWEQGPKENILTKVGWSNRRMKKFHNEELHISYSSPNTRQIKSRWMKWERHVPRMGEESVQDLGGKARGKETTWKTKAQMGGRDQNGS